MNIFVTWVSDQLSLRTPTFSSWNTLFTNAFKFLLEELYDCWLIIKLDLKFLRGIDSLSFSLNRYSPGLPNWTMLKPTRRISIFELNVLNHIYVPL